MNRALQIAREVFDERIGITKWPYQSEATRQLLEAVAAAALREGQQQRREEALRTATLTDLQQAVASFYQVHVVGDQTRAAKATTPA